VACICGLHLLPGAPHRDARVAFFVGLRAARDSAQHTVCAQRTACIGPDSPVIGTL